MDYQLPSTPLDGFDGKVLVIGFRLMLQDSEGFTGHLYLDMDFENKDALDLWIYEFKKAVHAWNNAHGQYDGQAGNRNACGYIQLEKNHSSRDRSEVTGYIHRPEILTINPEEFFEAMINLAWKKISRAIEKVHSLEKA